MDLRYAFRSMARNPGFTLLAVVVMGLGIGANTAVFSVVHSVLLRPLDYRDPDRIVAVRTYWKDTGRGRNVSGPDFHDWHDRTTAFDAMAYYADWETAVSAGSTAEYAHVAVVTPEFLRVFGARPEIGREFNAEETRPGSGGAVLISDTFWRSHYGGDAGVLGRTLRMDGRALTIVGVLPPRFRFPKRTDLWFPADTIERETASRSAHNYRVVARLKPGVTVARAQAETAAVAAQLERQYPESNRNKSALATPMRESLTGDVRPTLYLLFSAVALVLLIACANVANLLLAKATGRAREIAIRTAMGATRWRIVRLLAVESLLLALVSGGAGVLFAVWGESALVGIAPSNVPRLEETSIDASVLAFTVAASLASGVLFGLAPALHASRAGLNEALKQGAGRVVGGRAGRTRSALVVAEIALSVVLLAAAGLLMKSFAALQRTELGMRTDHVLVMSASAPSPQFFKRMLAAAAEVPGVAAVGASLAPPGDSASNGSYFVGHLPEKPSVAAPQAVFSIAAPGTLAALRIPLKRGRDLDARDTWDAPFVALVNDALARKSFPGQDPIGRQIFCGYDSMKPMTIVGVIGDVRQHGPASAPWPEIVMPYEQHPRGGSNLNLLARTAGEPEALADALRRKALEISPDVPVKFTTADRLLAENVAAPRFRMLLFGLFAGLAVSLAMAGVYGVMAYMVAQRTGEIGVRMALGARPRDVMALVLRQGLALAAAGLAIGLVAALAAARLLANMLFGVAPADPATYAAVAALLGAVALAAIYVPARRATRVDPLAALRQE